MFFRNRLDAAKKLINALEKYKGGDLVIYALPRGGVVLGVEIAKELDAPLDLVISRKIGHPLVPEYAVCAVAEDGDMLCDEFERVGLDEEWLKSQVEKERLEAKRRREVYLGGRKPVSAAGKTAIIVDDGIATGLTMLMAIKEVKHKKPAKIVAAVPLVSADVAEKIEKEVDELIALNTPKLFVGAIGAYYAQFPQVEDKEVINFLEKSKKQK